MSPEKGWDKREAVPLIFEVRGKNPGLARRSDAGSPRADIRLFCICCMGGTRSAVAECRTFICPFWPKRLGRGVDPRPDGTYPDLPPPKEVPAATLAALAAGRDKAVGVGADTGPGEEIEEEVEEEGEENEEDETVGASAPSR